MLRQVLPRAGRAFKAPAARQWLPLGARQAARWYSIKPEAASTSAQRGLDASRLSITKTDAPKPLQDPANLIFGREFTGTMAFPQPKPTRGALPPPLPY